MPWFVVNIFTSRFEKKTHLKRSKYILWSLPRPKAELVLWNLSDTWKYKDHQTHTHTHTKAKDCLSTLEISYNIFFLMTQHQLKRINKITATAIPRKMRDNRSCCWRSGVPGCARKRQNCTPEESDSSTYVFDIENPYYSKWMLFGRDQRERHPRRKTFENSHPHRSRNSERKQSY